MTTTYSTFLPVLDAATQNPLLDMVSELSSVYADSFQSDVSQLWISSARIIQEHAVEALMKASQDCMAALTQNAASIGEQSMAHLGNVNQRAVEIMSSAMAKTMAGGFKPEM